MSVLLGAFRPQSETPFRGGEEAEDAGGPTQTAPRAAHVLYRRRSSDPHTLRERMDFRRDHKYGRHRPLPDVPWRQHRERTYLDDAERLYGRKETWHTVQNEELREKLVAILQDYLRDTISSARLEIRDARKHKQLCESCAREYRAHITAGAFGSADALQDWARSILAVNTGAGARAGEAVAASRGEQSGSAGPQSATAGEDARAEEEAEANPELEEWRERRRRRGAEAVLEGSVAVADLPARDTHGDPVSAFPFLRQRAVESEQTLDPSLVDWTAKYFPADDRATFGEPPRLRQRQPANDIGPGGAVGSSDNGESRGEGDRAAEPEVRGQRPSAFGSSGDSSRSGLPKLHARHRLRRSLRSHEDRHRATFDAEGVFYHVRQPNEDDERAPRPKPVRGSEVSAPSATGGPATGGFVKVPWDVVSVSRKQGYTPDILRAKERLIRLTRGEDPETIP